MKLSDRISGFLSSTGATLKSIVKIILSGHHHTVTLSQSARDGNSIIILGNGPSLRSLIDENITRLSEATTMCVNFAANAPEFSIIRPDFYILADPHFFDAVDSDPNVQQLFKNINSLVDWKMTLFIPTGVKSASLPVTNENVKIERFNFIGIKGYEWFENIAFNSGLGLPRPRNVLVPAIMVAILAGFSTIYIAGADHSWLKTLSVTDENLLVTVQPHFYKDNNEEAQRVASVYKDVRLHDMLLSMHIAFKAYHRLERYATSRHIDIFNATPGSFIDAFRRKKPF